MATVIVSWMLAMQWRGLPIPQIIEAMAKKTRFMRTNQNVVITFSIDNEKDRVKVEKRHTYNLRNPYYFKRGHIISMYTDAPCITPDDYGGFKIVDGPDGKKLEGNELKNNIKNKPGKHIFSKRYILIPGDKQDKGDKNKFEFVSHDYYRLTDRLIWTVQDLSDGFAVKIINNTNIPNSFKVKINHHREEDMQNQIEKEDCIGQICFDFDTYILPYQGFEIMWNLERKTGEREIRDRQKNPS